MLRKILTLSICISLTAVSCKKNPSNSKDAEFLTSGVWKVFYQTRQGNQDWHNLEDCVSNQLWKFDNNKVVKIEHPIVCPTKGQIESYLSEWAISENKAILTIFHRPYNILSYTADRIVIEGDPGSSGQELNRYTLTR